MQRDGLLFVKMTGFKKTNTPPDRRWSYCEAPCTSKLYGHQQRLSLFSYFDSFTRAELHIAKNMMFLSLKSQHQYTNLGEKSARQNNTYQLLGRPEKPYIYNFGLVVVYLCGLIVQKIGHKKIHGLCLGLLDQKTKPRMAPWSMARSGPRWTDFGIFLVFAHLNRFF